MDYVYIHNREDNNEPFYIGVGGLTCFDNYQRANANNWKGLKSRSKLWHNYVNLYGFNVKILLDNCSKEDALLKEVELISKYGRKDINTGILVNHTDGGEGRVNSSKEINKKCGSKNIGRTWTKEQRAKIAAKAKLRSPRSKETRKKISLAHKGKPKNYRNNTAKYVINTITNQRFDTCKKAAESIGIKYGTLKAMLNGRNPNKTNLKYE